MENTCGAKHGQYHSGCDKRASDPEAGHQRQRGEHAAGEPEMRQALLAAKGGGEVAFGQQALQGRTAHDVEHSLADAGSREA